MPPGGAPRPLFRPESYILGGARHLVAKTIIDFFALGWGWCWLGWIIITDLIPPLLLNPYNLAFDSTTLKTTFLNVTSNLLFEKSGDFL